MNIWFSKSLFHLESLPAGFIRALIRFKDAGHDIGFSLDMLENHVPLLESEQVMPQFEDESQADLVISRSDISFKASDKVKSREYKSLAELAEKERFQLRTAHITRTTSETDISVKVNLDGEGKSDISTGLGFFDHMLDQIAKHGFIDLELSCSGDTHIDEHHTIEDVAIALGEAILKALPDKKGIGRYGFILAMDEAQAKVALDLSNRPYLVFKADFKREKVGDFPTEMTEHFFYSLAMSLRATMQLEVTASNDHHAIEALFKGFARSLRQALDRNEKYLNVLPSSKGAL